MEKILIIQLATSFVAGGLFIAALTLIAEYANEKVAGIILMFPSTIVLGFFFLGWATSPEKVVETIPTAIIPLGLLVLSAAIYIYTAKLIARLVKSKLKQVVITTIISSSAWLTLAIPFAIIRLSNLPVAITGYAIIVLMTHKILNKNHDNKEAKKPEYTHLQMLYRAIFMGTLIAIIVFLGKTLNPFWGGVFTMFPAATFSALIFFHLNYSPKELFRFMKKVPIGSISLLVYTLMVMMLFPRYGISLGSLGAYLVSLISSLTLIRLAK